MASIRSCYFNRNTNGRITGGAIIVNNSNADIVRTIFTQNSANIGASIYVTRVGFAIGAMLDITECTFSSNSTSRDGGAIYFSDAALMAVTLQITVLVIIAVFFTF